MLHELFLIIISCFSIPSSALFNNFGLSSPSLITSNNAIPLPKLNYFGKRKTDTIDHNPDGSPFIWLPQDEYSGKSFYDRWDFFAFADPTNGSVRYVNKTEAFERNFTYVQDDGVVIMKADTTSKLDLGVFRDSVRIQSQTTYNTGLFILDLNTAPWGCGTWPAFWTVGGNWPYNGEIDILEGVHDNQHNQVAWHTGPGCVLNANSSTNFTGTIAIPDVDGHVQCNGLINSNSGCGVSEWSRASYGPNFDAQGGGVFAMKWDENGIAVWSFFRAAVPADVVEGTPNPSNWGLPSAALDASGCNITQFFANHSIVFDITFCGDWAGSSYATSGCPGTCQDRLMDPINFENATWSINYVKVYQKQLISGRVVNAAPQVKITNFQILLSTAVVLVIAALF